MDEIKMSMQGGVFLTLALAALLGSAWVVKTRLDNGQKVWKLVMLSAAPVGLCAALVLAGTHHLVITLTAILGLCTLVGAFLGVVLSRHHQIRDIPVLGVIFGVLTLGMISIVRGFGKSAPGKADSVDETEDEHHLPNTLFPNENFEPLGPTRKQWTASGFVTVPNYDDD